MSPKTRPSFENIRNDGISTPSNSSKKRKASDLHDEPRINGHNGITPQSIGKKSSSTKKPLTSSSKTTTDIIPFQVGCPAKPASSQHYDQMYDVFRAKDNPAIENLDVEYTIRPGNKWASTRAYRNVKLLEQTFTTGQIIYVNRRMPAPPPPPDDAPDFEVLQYDKTNLWVGKIAQAKAESDKAVFLRVFWLYWPEELPMGRQPYHGDRELVMSNAMDIIDAQSIACAAEVSHWDESDDDQDVNQKERFWRQTFDVNKLGRKNQGGLSTLRKHCICQKEYNPDTTMFKCSRSDCGTWNHESCLLEDLLQRAWKAKEKGLRLNEEFNGKIQDISKSKSMTDTIIAEPSNSNNKIQNSPPSSKLTPHAKKTKPKHKPLSTTINGSNNPLNSNTKPKPWTNNLSAKISISTSPSTNKSENYSLSEEQQNDITIEKKEQELEDEEKVEDMNQVTAILREYIIHDKITTKTKMTKNKVKEEDDEGEYKEWMIILDCLKCYHILD